VLRERKDVGPALDDEDEKKYIAAM